MPKKTEQKSECDFQLNARIPHELAARARKEAELADLSLSQVVRRALQHELDRMQASRVCEDGGR